jgi:hypothetical protein
VPLVLVVAFVVTVVTGPIGIRGWAVRRILTVTLVVCVAMVLIGLVRFSIHLGRPTGVERCVGRSSA